VNAITQGNVLVEKRDGVCNIMVVEKDICAVIEEDIPTASHSPKGEWRHMRFTVDTVSQDREGSTHLLYVAYM